MIKAQHNWSADKIFRIYIFRMLKKHFASVTLFGKLPESDPLLPTLLIPNHNTWWDGFFVYFLNETVAKQGKCAKESQLDHQSEHHILRVS